MPEGQTEEEHGQKSKIFTSVEAYSYALDFAVPLPTSLTLGHLLPGRRFYAVHPSRVSSNATITALTPPTSFPTIMGRSISGANPAVNPR